MKRISHVNITISACNDLVTRSSNFWPTVPIKHALVKMNSTTGLSASPSATRVSPPRKRYLTIALLLCAAIATPGQV